VVGVPGRRQTEWHVALSLADVRFAPERSRIADIGGCLKSAANSGLMHHSKQHHSITSSARPSIESGKVRPSALAVFMLITNCNFVTCCTGKSAGFSPLRMRPV
jgi:hypothetical protein